MYFFFNVKKIIGYLDGQDEYLNFLRAQIGQPPLDKKVAEIFWINTKEICSCWIGYRERARDLFPVILDKEYCST